MLPITQGARRGEKLTLCREYPDFHQLEKLEDTEIRLALCENWTDALVQSSDLTEGDSPRKVQE